MKKLVFAAFLLIAFASCTKTAEETPDLSLIVQGNYNVTFLKSGTTSFNLPINNATGRASAILSFFRKDKTISTGSLLLTINGNATTTQLGDIVLKDAGNGQVTLVDNGVTIGTGTAKNIDVNQTTNGTTTIINASR